MWKFSCANALRSHLALALALALAPPRLNTTLVGFMYSTKPSLLPCAEGVQYKYFNGQTKKWTVDEKITCDFLTKACE